MVYCLLGLIVSSKSDEPHPTMIKMLVHVISGQPNEMSIIYKLDDWPNAVF